MPCVVEHRNCLFTFEKVLQILNRFIHLGLTAVDHLYHLKAQFTQNGSH